MTTSTGTAQHGATTIPSAGGWFWSVLRRDLRKNRRMSASGEKKGTDAG